MIWLKLSLLVKDQTVDAEITDGREEEDHMSVKDEGDESVKEEGDDLHGLEEDLTGQDMELGDAWSHDDADDPARLLLEAHSSE